MSRPRFLSCLLLSVLLSMSLSSVSAVSANGASDQVLSPRLERALNDIAFPWRTDEGRYTVWVYFQDKGLSKAQLDDALDQAEKQLSERAAWRRAKVTAKGDRLVTTGDLPVDAGYLAQVKNTGAEMRRESRWLNAASFQVTESQLQQLSQLVCVKKIDLVTRFKRPELTSLSTAEVEAQNDALKSDRWSIDYGSNLAAMEQANVPPVHEMGITGEGVLVGMLDSGFRTAHEALNGINVLATYDFVNDDENVDNEPGDPSDARNHGTMTMSTTMGNMPGSLVAPAFGVSAVLAKTEDTASEVPIEEDQWVAGLEWVETFGVDIVSSSLGYSDWYTWADMDGNTAVTTICADLAAARGIVVVNSAGNERGASWDHIIAPADGDSVITVGAVTSSGSYTYFSSPGPSYDGRIKPDVTALGSSNYVADPNDDYGYTTASGTSFSCPLTSGVAALILSRAPNLTPMQVREALRETADRADNPDNDYGWGIINAFAAVNYFGPSYDHASLGDSENTVSPYTVSAVVTDRIAVDTGSVQMVYRIDGGAWQTVAMVNEFGTDTYKAEIPAQAAGTDVDYYLTASSTGGITTLLPAQAPTEFYSFHVGPDASLPVLTHTALRDQAYIMWPANVACIASDNLGIDRVELTFTLNGGSVQGPYLLVPGAGDVYSLPFPLTPAEVVIGDQITYEIRAYDAAGVPNMVLSGPHDFEIIDTLGVVLVLEDNAVARQTDDVKYDETKRLLTAEEGKSSATSMADWLIAAGYVAEILPAAGVSVDDFAGYQAVVLSCGNNTAPVENAATRTALQNWVAGGGKLLLEGGELGYDALSSPGYPDFASQVLHAVDWDSDNAGALQATLGQADHPLLSIPHPVAATLQVAYDGYGDEDAVEPAADAYIVMGTANHVDDAGILVYDDNPAPQSAQIVYFAFNVEALDGDNGRYLVENALGFLLATESGASSSLAGRITLSGESDHSGIQVTIGGGNTTVTAADGTWELVDLYGGTYTLMASKDGFATIAEPIVLDDNEHLTGLDFQLQQVFESHYSISPGLAIPDDDDTGISSVITVPAGEADQVSDITVDLDITHTWRGDLTVTLTSPTGTSVVLHNGSGSSADDILGNYPETLSVEGPGTLESFIGENNGGDWVLLVTDSAGSDTGTLNSWGLNFTLPSGVTPVGDTLPVLTRLNNNVPNPFNPATTISFDLARAGHAQVSIFDVRGARVCDLVNEQLTAGTHSYRWDGRDRAGRSVSSGTYLYRLQSGDTVVERKMLLVR